MIENQAQCVRAHRVKSASPQLPFISLKSLLLPSCGLLLAAFRKDILKKECFFAETYSVGFFFFFAISNLELKNNNNFTFLVINVLILKSYDLKNDNNL